MGSVGEIGVYTMRTLISEVILKSIDVKNTLLHDVQLLNQIESLAVTCLNSIRSSGKIIFAGNGGSFADAQHLSAEFSSRFLFDRAPMASLVLGANNSTISAIGNDYGFEQVFARELTGIAKTHDVFIPISTSGTSSNILASVKQAKLLGLATIALTGIGGGKLADMCDCICVPSNETARIQECHILIGHIICELVEFYHFKDRT